MIPTKTASFSGLIALAAVLLVTNGCTSSRKTYVPTSTAYSSYSQPIVIIDDNDLRKTVSRRLEEVFAATENPVPHAELVKQLSRTTCALSLPRENYLTLTPGEIYQRALKSTVMVAIAYHCNNKSCKRLHVNIASGVTIHPDGVVVTNYHVVDSSMQKIVGIGVATITGDIYIVDEVLAANKEDDVAIIQLRNAKDLPTVAIFRDEPVGNPVTVVSHPRGQFYTLTQGFVSRYTRRKEQTVMNITADYAQGSSGGPVFNNRGNLVGLVSSTSSLATTNVPLSLDEEDNSLSIKTGKKEVAKVQGKPLVMQANHQMTVRNCVPSRAILDLIQEVP